MAEDDLPEASKLTRSKLRWAAEHKAFRGRGESERLPPGQHRVEDWPVLDLGEQPAVAEEQWRLDVRGLVGKPLTIDWNGFLALPLSAVRSDIHCVTSWSRFDNDWQGVLTRDLLDAVEPAESARFVMLTSYDGYTTNLPLDDFAAPDAILAHRWQGQPISRAHGGPMRLVVPHLYFWKSAKWLNRIDFIPADKAGFWEMNGYHMRGDPWAEERYS
ncbi:MAG: sulfite oxidase-like oxidoreductase [Pararhizobium sp.]